MRRRVDEGQLQLLRQRRLLQQKQGLVARGERVLAEHARATWRQPAAAPAQQLEQDQSAELPGVTVHSLVARCSAGQWWLQAVVSLQPDLQQQVERGHLGATLLAASSACTLACRQQQCSRSSSAGRGLEAPDAAVAQLHLTALLDIEQQQVQQQEQQQEQQGDAWADVFLLLEASTEPDLAAAAASSSPAALAAALAGPTALPPVLLSRVQLPWGEWLRSHTQDSQAPPSPPPAELHRRVLAVEAQELGVCCLCDIVQRQLGCTPAAADGDAARGGGMQRRSYVLQSPTEQAAAVHITQHSSTFAEVELCCGSARMADVLQQQLALGLRQAEAAAGVAAGGTRLSPSLLSPQQASLQAAAAGALVEQLSASIEWVEALLKEKLALSSQLRRHKAAPDPAAVRQRQVEALAATAAASGAMVRMLTAPRS